VPDQLRRPPGTDANWRSRHLWNRLALRDQSHAGALQSISLIRMTNLEELRGRRVNESNSLRLFLTLLSLCTFAAAPARGQISPSSIAQQCFRLGDTPRGYCSAPESIDCPGYRIWLETCQQALAANPNDPRVKLALSLAVRVVTGNREEAVALMRSAAEQDDPEAWLALYEEHRSFNRRLDRPQTITRAEAEKALRRAAELGHPDAIFRLATALYRGGVGLKRDLANGRVWGERALARPPKDMRASDIQPVVGHWLSQSDDPEVRKRGIALLEALPGRGDAQAYLAEAIRMGDPAHARKLLEGALRTYPGHALAPLAEMLIAGEGGPKDERRALSLLQRAPADAQQAKALLGCLTLEGRLVRRDVSQAVGLLLPWSQWDYDTWLLIANVLAENPDVPLSRPDGFLYDAIEFAELGEPGALDALIALKKSRNPKFSDPAGAHSLAERAAKLGNNLASRRLEQCRPK
jgi:TPR repeat protein